MKYTVIFTLFIAMILLSTEVHATSKKGSLDKRNIIHNGCKIKKMTVKYALSHLFGEPTKSGTFKWSKGAETASDCLTYDVKVYLEVVPENSNQSTFVELSPTVPKAGRGFGMNATGSPSWDDMFCSVGGGNCMDAQSAKLVMKGNYSVVGFQLSGGSETASKKEAMKAKVERQKKAARDREIAREKERQRQAELKRQQELEQKRQAALEKERKRLAAIERRREEREWERQRQLKKERMEEKRKKRMADEERRKRRKKFRKDSFDRVDEANKFKNKVKEGMSQEDRRRLDEQLKLQKKLGLGGCDGIRDRVVRRKCESMY